MSITTFIIVPARSGSKGIPDKNVNLLGGKPLIAWTAAAIKAAALKDSLAVLSTDSASYAAIGRASGLAVPFIRPASAAQDSSSSMAVIEHALDWFKQQYNALPEQVMLLQPTSPFRSGAALQQALAMLQTRQADSVIGCKAIQRDLTTLFNLENGFLQPLDKNQTTQTRRQDNAPLLTPNGAMYLCNTHVMLTNKSLYGARTLPMLMDALSSLDIDTPMDWAMAEAFIAAKLVDCGL